MDNQQLSSNIEWRIVEDYDHYEVNNLGQVRHRQRQKFLNLARIKVAIYMLILRLTVKTLISQFIDWLQRLFFPIQTICQKLIIRTQTPRIIELRIWNGAIVLIIQITVIRNKRIKIAAERW